jgi:hypothetical protein
MRIFVITICSLALATGAYSAQQEENKKQKKKQPQTVQHAPAATTGHPTGAGANPKHTSMEAYHRQQGAYHGQQGINGHPSTEAYHEQKGKRAQTSNAAYQPQKAKKNQTQAGRQTAKAANERQTAKTPPPRVPGVEPGNVSQVKGAGKPNQAKTATTAGQNAAKGKFAQGKPVKPQHFTLSKQPNTAKAPPVKFQQGRHIQGSQNWRGQQYTVFRTYSSQWHNQNWWHNHYRNNIVFVFGAPYYWNAGYWFPAWGYYPNAYYAWDGPVYGYNHLPPDQVIANVQATLQQQGYYQGEVDGLIGPLTRGAVADYQRDHGLYITSAIDQPTLQSLGMT